MIRENETTFEEHVNESTYQEVIAYCNENDLSLEDFCRKALEVLKKG